HTAIIQLCGRLEGLPLGIQLAAVSVRTVTCQQLVAALEHKLDFLAATSHPLPAHRILLAILEHCWQLLTAVEKYAFQRLAIFEGTFTAKAVQEVAEISPTV